MQVVKDGRTWRIGTRADVDWIANGTTVDRTITSAIPPVFDSYATFHNVESGDENDESTVLQERALLSLLEAHSSAQPWWLGFLDTGAHDVVFDEAPRVKLYSDWSYVLVEAGSAQAAAWRTGHMRSGRGTLPDLMFPADRSWLVSALWDDTWTCIGGAESLVVQVRRDPRVRARPVALGQDATPPGHESF